MEIYFVESRSDHLEITVSPHIKRSCLRVTSWGLETSRNVLILTGMFGLTGYFRLNKLLHFSCQAGVVVIRDLSQCAALAYNGASSEHNGAFAIKATQLLLALACIGWARFFALRVDP